MVTENTHVRSKKSRKRKGSCVYRSRKRVKYHLPTLTTSSTECCFCKDGENQELGRFFTDKIANIAAHQFCLLFSAGLPQLGEDEDGFDGFLLPDVFKEANRAHKIYCKLCGKPGANSGCSVKSCRNLYHFKCGLKNGMQFIFAGAFDSYCKHHRSYQDMSLLRKINVQPTCPVCLEKIVPRNVESILKTPCCKNVFMHRSCVQRQAHASGYFFRCPTCNNEKAFTYEMAKYGIYVPLRDAEWEETGAFSELLEQYEECDYIKCKSHRGRNYHTKSGEWNLLKCYGCGQSGIHVVCLGNRYVPGFGYVCSVCKTVICKATEGIETQQRSYLERWRQHKLLLQKLKARDDPVLLASAVFGRTIWCKRFGIKPCTVVIEPLNFDDATGIQLDANAKKMLQKRSSTNPAHEKEKQSKVESGDTQCVKSNALNSSGAADLLLNINNKERSSGTSPVKSLQDKENEARVESNYIESGKSIALTSGVAEEVPLDTNDKKGLSRTSPVKSLHDKENDSKVESNKMKSRKSMAFTSGVAEEVPLDTNDKKGLSRTSPVKSLHDKENEARVESNKMKSRKSMAFTSGVAEEVPLDTNDKKGLSRTSPVKSLHDKENDSKVESNKMKSRKSMAFTSGVAEEVPLDTNDKKGLTKTSPVKSLHDKENDSKVESNKMKSRKSMAFTSGVAEEVPLDTNDKKGLSRTSPVKSLHDKENEARVESSNMESGKSIALTSSGSEEILLNINDKKRLSKRSTKSLNDKENDSKVESNNMESVKSITWNSSGVYNLRRSFLRNERCNAMDSAKLVPSNSWPLVTNSKNDATTNDIKGKKSISALQEGSFLKEVIIPQEQTPTNKIELPLENRHLLTASPIKTELGLSMICGKDNDVLDCSQIDTSLDVKFPCEKQHAPDDKSFFDNVSMGEPKKHFEDMIFEISDIHCSKDSKGFLLSFSPVESLEDFEDLNQHNATDTETENSSLFPAFSVKKEFEVIETCTKENGCLDPLLMDTSSCKQQLDLDDQCCCIQANTDRHKDLFDDKIIEISDVKYCKERQQFTLEFSPTKVEDKTKYLECARENKKNQNILTAFSSLKDSSVGNSSDSSDTTDRMVLKSLSGSPIRSGNYMTRSQRKRLNSPTNYSPTNEDVLVPFPFPNKKRSFVGNFSANKRVGPDTVNHTESSPVSGYMTRSQMKRLRPEINRATEHSPTNLKRAECSSLISSLPPYESFVPQRKRREKCMCQLNGHLLNRYYIRKNDWIRMKLNWCIVHNVAIPVKVDSPWKL